jgi:hypothetical protein
VIAALPGGHSIPGEEAVLLDPLLIALDYVPAADAFEHVENGRLKFDMVAIGVDDRMVETLTDLSGARRAGKTGHDGEPPRASPAKRRRADQILVHRRRP